jgi:hypothetical protein
MDPMTLFYVGQYVERAFASVHPLIEFAAFMPRQLRARLVDHVSQLRAKSLRLPAAFLGHRGQFSHGLTQRRERVDRGIEGLRPQKTSEPAVPFHLHAAILHP